MQKSHLWVLRGDFEYVWLKIPKRGGEQQRGAVQRDHASHGFLDVSGFRHFFFFDHLDPRHLGHRSGALCMRLVIPKIVSWSDIDEPDYGWICCPHRQSSRPPPCGRERRAAEQRTT